MTLKEQFQAKCKELQLEEKYGSGCVPNTNLRFVQTIAETEVIVTWFFNGEQEKRTIGLSEFLTLNLNELREISDLCYTVDKALVTAKERIAALEAEKTRLVEHSEKIETGFVGSLDALLTSLEGRDE